MGHTYNVCNKCHSLNKVDVSKAKDQKAICGKCGADLHFHKLVIETDAAGLQKIMSHSDKPLIVDFWAPWCGPCRMLAPTFEKVSEEVSGDYIFVKVNTEENPQISQQMGIRGIPTLIKFDATKEVKRISGALSTSQLKNWIK